MNSTPVKQLKAEVTLKEETSDGNALVKSYYPMAVGILRKLALTGSETTRLGAARTLIETHVALVTREEQQAVITTLEEQLRESEYNMLYVKHFPRHKKYLSLFPSAEGDNPYVAKQRNKIRAMLIRRACNGTLETKERRCASSSNSADAVADADGEVEGGESKDGVEGLDGDEFFAPAPVLLAAPAKRGRG